MTTMEIYSASSSGTQGQLVLTSTGDSGNLGAHAPPWGMPAVVPASELYFWTEKWRAQERAFDDARAAGQLIEAASMDEVVHDLMRVRDDD